jgi:D-methionine transport system substrate-binding protein
MDKTPNNFNKAVQAWYTVTAIIVAFIFFVTYTPNPRFTQMPVVENYYNPANRAVQSNLRLGIIEGPYGEVFLSTIGAALNEKGYTLTLHTFKDYTELNLALANGDIDMNLFQSISQFNRYRFDQGLVLTAISKFPTLPMAIFSDKIDCFSQLSNARVAVPENPTHISQALVVLEQAGLIRLDPYIGKTHVTVEDIIHNPHQLLFVATDPFKTHEMLDELELAVIGGNYIINAGLAYDDALYVEAVTENFFNVIAINTSDMVQPFANDIIRILSSPAFKAGANDGDGLYALYQNPPFIMNGISWHLGGEGT